MTDSTGDFEEAVRETNKVLAVRGQVVAQGAQVAPPAGRHGPALDGRSRGIDDEGEHHERDDRTNEP